MDNKDKALQIYKFIYFMFQATYVPLRGILIFI